MTDYLLGGENTIWVVSILGFYRVPNVIVKPVGNKNATWGITRRHKNVIGIMPIVFRLQ